MNGHRVLLATLVGLVVIIVGSFAAYNNLYVDVFEEPASKPVEDVSKASSVVTKSSSQIDLQSAALASSSHAAPSEATTTGSRSIVDKLWGRVKGLWSFKLILPSIVLVLVVVIITTIIVVAVSMDVPTEDQLTQDRQAMQEQVLRQTQLQDEEDQGTMGILMLVGLIILSIGVLTGCGIGVYKLKKWPANSLGKPQPSPNEHKIEVLSIEEDKSIDSAIKSINERDFNDINFKPESFYFKTKNQRDLNGWDLWDPLERPDLWIEYTKETEILGESNEPKIYNVKELASKSRHSLLIFDNQIDALCVYHVSSKCSNDNIVSAKDVFTHDGKYYVLAEPLDDLNFYTRLERSGYSIDERTASVVLREILSGLRYLHRRLRVTHNSVNLSSVMIVGNKSLKLLIQPSVDDSGDYSKDIIDLAESILRQAEFMNYTKMAAHFFKIILDNNNQVPTIASLLEHPFIKQYESLTVEKMLNMMRGTKQENK